MEFVCAVVNAERKFVLVYDTDVNHFVNTVAVTFGISSKQEYRVRLFGSNGAEIVSGEMFAALIPHYIKSPEAFIQINFQDETPPEKKEIICQVLKTFLVENGGSSTVNEMLLGKTYSQQTKNRLVELLADFVVQNFGLYPTKEQKVSVSKVAVKLFPVLRVKNSKLDGIDLLFSDYGKGWLVEKLKRRRQAIRKQKKKEALYLNQNQLDQTDQNEYTEADAKQDFDILKSIVVNNENIEQIQKKLVLTRNYRAQIMLNMNTDLKECFPYFFVQPKLILFDFEKNPKYEMVAPDALTVAWSSWSKMIVKKREAERSSFKTMWPEEIENALFLLLFLPCMQPKTVFGLSIGKFIRFHKVITPLNTVEESGNKFPFIVASGATHDEIVRFYIAVETYLIQVPDGFTFIQVVDFFFKTHKVFNLTFAPQLKNMMMFLEFFAYRIPLDKRNKPSSTVIQLQSYFEENLE